MVAIGVIVAATSVAYGQAYPSKPVRIITGGVGGAADFAARLIARGLSSTPGWTVVVDNRGGIIPMETVAKSPPDGYVLLLHGSTIWLTPILQDNVSYDPVADLSPITLTNMSPNILVIHPSLPVKSVKDLIALAKAKPGKLNYASAGTGGSSHLAAALFNAMAGVDIVRIIYKGSTAALTDLISGEVQLTFNALAATVPHVKAGKLRALAVTSARRSSLLPDLPTIAEMVPGYEASSILGVLAPAKTPARIITQLNQEVVRVLNSAEVKQRFLRTGVETVGNSPEQFVAVIKAEMAKYGKIFKGAGVKGG